MTCVLGVIFIQHLDKEVGAKFYRAYIQSYLLQLYATTWKTQSIESHK